MRANQGQSIQGDVELKTAEPPEMLYHGTGKKYVASIRTEGLKPQSRLYVHLSRDVETAMNVGSRHGQPYIFRVCAGEMFRQGYQFWISENGVWLTKAVPAEYLEET